MELSLHRDLICSHFIEQVKDYAFFSMDIQGRITSWNLGAERIKGYSEQEVIGQHLGILFPESYRKVVRLTGSPSPTGFDPARHYHARSAFHLQ